MSTKITILVLVMAAMIVAPAVADVVTVSGPSQVEDAVVRGDEPDANLGQHAGDKVSRMFVDANGWGVGRHWLVKFDLSAIPTGSTIVSATYGIYVRRNSGRTVPTVNDYQISRLQAGKGWIEGLDDYERPARAGDVTWSHQAFGSTPWETGGATGASDIDLATSVSWDVAGNNIDPGYITVDLKNMVQDWVSGTWENNGMLHWGGTYETPVGDNQVYNWTYSSESIETTRLPYLTIEYTVVPEPSSLLALAAFGAAGLGFIRRRRS
ncbi:MAG: DNRLRE domain-containing protein [Armatimonadota bacterium]|nr:DNRLRE domain-containing protein [Armatimonadota bacterium]